MSEGVVERPAPSRVQPISPGPRSSWPGMAWRQYRLERRMFRRNPIAAFFSAGIPLLFLVVFGVAFSGNRDQIEILIPGIAAMVVMTTTFNTLAHNIVALRERGILKRLAVTPMPPSAYVSALGAHAFTNTVLQVAVVTAIGALVFGLGWPRDPALMAGLVIAGAATFAALGVALATLVPNAESAPAYVNAIFLPVVGISGVFYDESTAPAIVEDLAGVLPLAHLVDGLRAAMLGGGFDLASLAVLLAWGAGGLMLALRGLRRSPVPRS